MEIELKLLVAPEDLARVLKSGAVTRRNPGRQRTTDVLSVYYDTPGFDLTRSGLALRLRRSGARWLQALKADSAVAAGGGAGLHEREEYEWFVSGQQLDFALLDATPYGAVFSKRRVREALQPVFSTHFRRSVRRLGLAAGSEAELSADLGEIRAGVRAEPISEVEIELRGGVAAQLYEFARDLLIDVPFRLGAFSKAERGYALARNEIPKPRKARPVALRADASAEESFRRIAGSCLAHVHANEDGFLCGRDPEYLHQLRVGFRRLRIALGMPDDAGWRETLKPLRAELRWLSSVLGPARNWDVFLTELLPPVARYTNGEPGLKMFRVRCQQLRRKHLGIARKAVAGPRYQELLLSLGSLLAGALPTGGEDASLAPTWTSGSAGLFARSVVERRERSLRKRGDRVVGGGAEERHQARIAAKKLRYCIEFFQTLFPDKKLKRYIDGLAGLQDALGAANDAAVAARLIDEAGASGKVDPRFIGMVQGWTAAGEARAIEQLARAWAVLAVRKPYWE